MSKKLTDEQLKELISTQTDITLDSARGSGETHKLDSEILSALKELKEYRDIGPTPEQLKEVDRLYMEKCREVDGLKKQMTWIPCSERMPEDMKNVLVWLEYFNRPYQTYGLGYARNGKWSGFVNGQCVYRDLKILAWMPLPERYEETGNE